MATQMECCPDGVTIRAKPQKGEDEGGLWNNVPSRRIKNAPRRERAGWRIRLAIQANTRNGTAPTRMVQITSCTIIASSFYGSRWAGQSLNLFMQLDGVAMADVVGQLGELAEALLEERRQILVGDCVVAKYGVSPRETLWRSLCSSLPRAPLAASSP